MKRKSSIESSQQESTIVVTEPSEFLAGLLDAPLDSEKPTESVVPPSKVRRQGSKLLSALKSIANRSHSKWLALKRDSRSRLTLGSFIYCSFRCYNTPRHSTIITTEPASSESDASQRLES